MHYFYSLWRACSSEGIFHRNTLTFRHSQTRSFIFFSLSHVFTHTHSHTHAWMYPEHTLPHWAHTHAHPKRTTLSKYFTQRQWERTAVRRFERPKCFVFIPVQMRFQLSTFRNNWLGSDNIICHLKIKISPSVKWSEKSQGNRLGDSFKAIII